MYIPASLRPTILTELHSTHTGMEKMKQLARRHVYWPGIDKEIENVVSSCVTCAKLNKNPPKVPVHKWEPATAPWARIHIDYAGPKDGIYYFVVIDAYSNWTEIFAAKTAPTSLSTIKYLGEIFSRNGLPIVLVSDNATIFKSDDFEEFCKKYGINHKFSAPNHPASNGKAERAVGVLKQRLNAIKSPIKDIQTELNKILFKWRVTPLANGKSPDELYLNRKLRTTLDIIRPPPVERKSSDENQPKIKKSFNVGDRVLSRNYQGEKWLFGIIHQRLGKLHFNVKLDNGRIIKRHIDQLRITKVPLNQKPEEKSSKSVKINPSPIIHYYNRSTPEPNKILEPPTNQSQVQMQRPQQVAEPVRRSSRVFQKPRWLNQYVS